MVWFPKWTIKTHRHTHTHGQKHSDGFLHLALFSLSRTLRDWRWNAMVCFASRVVFLSTLKLLICCMQFHLLVLLFFLFLLFPRKFGLWIIFCTNFVLDYAPLIFWFIHVISFNFLCFATFYLSLRLLFAGILITFRSPNEQHHNALLALVFFSCQTV